MSPAKVQSLLQSALSHHKAGRLAEAERLYRQLRAAVPNSFDALHLSGLLAQQEGRTADAAGLLGRAHALNPAHRGCETRLGLACNALGRFEQAEAHLRHAVQTAPDSHEGWDFLAYCLKTQNRLLEAIECHKKAVALAPAFATGWYNYGLTLSLAGRSFEALGCHERAIAADPDCALGRFGRAQALQQTHRIPEAVEDYGRFLALQPRHHEARSYRLFALHYLDGIAPEKLHAEHLAYGRAVGGPVPREFAHAVDPARRLRVAFLSPDLRAHSCAHFVEPLVRHLDRGSFEIYLYHDHFREDAVSARLREQATVWRNFVGQPAAAVEQRILADAPDILIDLAGHTGLNRLPLLARRLAPVQVTYLGYPNTTAVEAIDYRLTDATSDPAPEADEFATETLVRFAPTAWSYEPQADAPEVAPAPCFNAGHVTFGCFNNLAKVTDRMLAVWGRILQATPDSRLRLKGQGFSDPQVRARYVERFARAGLPADRVDLVERTAGAADHLAVYGEVDIALDTAPYHGTTTTCEALWMGVPVVTLVGRQHMSRVGASLLTAVGHPEWCAADEAAYVQIATDLARDHFALAQLRATLRDAMLGSALLDHGGQAARFGAALRACWQDWCGTKSHATSVGQLLRNDE
ncbi:MAG: tetratricopeptide repeat protein [Opitutaceae bacterium]|nr:tetratricopeptide repeat protein [Opitutaceae bacterium]